MKLKIFPLLFLFCFSTIIKAQEQYVVSWDYRDLSFKDFISKAQPLLNVKFFYKDEWVTDLKMGDYGKDKSLQEILNYLLAGKSLFFYIDETGNVVLTKNYAVKVAGNPMRGDSAFIPPTDYADTPEEQKLRGNIIVEIGNLSEKNNPGDVVLSGYITNRDSREPVAGVTVFNKKLSVGTISNEYGFYSLILPRGVNILQYSFIGMKEKEVNLNIYSTGELNVEMNSMLIPLKETVISAQKSMTIQRYEVGAEKINITSFKLLPTSMGESDIIKECSPDTRGAISRRGICRV